MLADAQPPEAMSAASVGVREPLLPETHAADGPTRAQVCGELQRWLRQTGCLGRRSECPVSSHHPTRPERWQPVVRSHGGRRLEGETPACPGSRARARLPPQRPVGLLWSALKQKVGEWGLLLRPRRTPSPRNNMSCPPREAP